MTIFQNPFSSLFKKNWPIFVIVVLLLIFFYPVWLQGKIPLPGDFIVGTYHPWLDYKWGYDVGVPVKNLLTSDVVSVIYPLRIYAIDQIKSGQIPFWNSAMLGGYPLLANFQVAIFVPTIIFYFFMSNTSAWTMQIIFQPLVSMLGMFLLLRHFGVKKIPSIVGSVVFAFSGFSMVWLEWNVHALVAAFIPYIFLAYDKYLENGNIKHGVLISLFVCLQAISGYPQVLLYSLFLVSMWGIFKFKSVGFKRLLCSAFFLLSGVVLASPLLLPAFELLFNSQRQSEVLDDNLRYLPIKSLITFLAPDYYGNPATNNYWGEGNYGLNTLYSGVTGFLLAIFGFWKTKGKLIGRFFMFIFLASFFLALQTPFGEIIYHRNVAGLSALSPTRIFVLVNFSVAVLSAFGLDYLNSIKKNYKFLVIPVLLVLSVLLLTLYITKYVGLENVSESNLLIATRNLILPILLTTGFGVILLINKIEKLRNITVLLFCSILIFEMFRYGWKFTPFTSKDLTFPETPTTSFLKNQEKPFRISTQDTIPMNMWIPYSLESISGYDAVYPLWWAQMNSTIRNNNADLSPVGRYAELETYQSPWFDFLNIKYVVAIKRKLGIPASDGDIDYRLHDPKFVKIFEDRSVAVLENKKASSRALFFSDWETNDDHRNLELLISKDFPLDRKVLLNEPFDGFEKSSQLNAKTEYIFYSPNKYQIEVDSDKDGLLFVSDIYYPGWEVKVDGKSEKIYKADYAFKAVPVGRGKHLVEFVYNPKSFYVGVLLFLLTGSVLILLNPIKNFLTKK